MNQTTVNIRNLIRTLNRLDLSCTDYPTLVSMFRDAIIGIRVSIGLSPSTELYFRARICNSPKPSEVHEIAAPPAEFVSGFQRCNPPKHSMFYSASKRLTALLECDVQPGDVVYLSQWANNKPTPRNRILLMDDEQEGVSLNANEQLLHSYIDTIFTRQIHETFSDAYKLTAALTEVLTTGFTPNGEHDIRDDRTVGLIYPSVVDITGSYNTVFHAPFSSERLVPFTRNGA